MTSRHLIPCFGGCRYPSQELEHDAVKRSIKFATVPIPALSTTDLGSAAMCSRAIPPLLLAPTFSLSNICQPHSQCIIPLLCGMTYVYFSTLSASSSIQQLFRGMSSPPCRPTQCFPRIFQSGTSLERILCLFVYSQLVPANESVCVWEGLTVWTSCIVSASCLKAARR